MLELRGRESKSLTIRQPLPAGVETRVWFISNDKSYQEMWLRRYGIVNPNYTLFALTGGDHASRSERKEHN